MKKGFFLLYLSSACFFLAAAGPADILYITENYAPSNYVEEGELKGVAVDLLKAVWKQMGVDEQPILVYPWARGYQTVLNRPDTVLFAMSRTVDRENLFKWVGPIYRGRYSFISLSGADYSIPTIEEAKSLLIGVIREDLGEKILRDRGIPDSQISRVSSLIQLVQMLEAGRIDLICVYEDTIYRFLSGMTVSPSLFETKLVLTETVMYYAFNRETSDGLVTMFQEALDQIEDQRRAIVKRYQGIP
jgi:polar amino acid transport system substrate-binding protein